MTVKRATTSYSIDVDIRHKFKIACVKNSEDMGRVIEKLMLIYIEKGIEING